MFAYGHIKRQREINGWKDVRIHYYIGTTSQKTLVGTWEPSRGVGLMSVIGCVADAPRRDPRSLVEEILSGCAPQRPKQGFGIKHEVPR
ncbi:MAG: hypothetical protein EOM91_10420 [Sphingobacteriia bacterium]|jgi:hypothetical protein|nr:hypothetical protein [Sphingobacteriia bacterium]